MHLPRSMGDLSQKNGITVPAEKAGMYVVARNFCLALPGCCLAKHAYLFWAFNFFKLP